MRALPGREIRTALDDPEARLNRETVADRQRRRIRRATGELVAKRGYSGVSVELIIKRAQVGYRTFYKHYANKEAAFADLFDTTVADTEARVREAMASAGGSWPDQVAVAIRTFFEAIAAEPLIARACLVEGSAAGPAILARYEDIAKAFVPILREGRTYSPESRALPATMEDTLAGALLWSAYQRLAYSDTERIAELIPENVELLLRPYLGKAEAARIAAADLADPLA
jgi:AcrR family transcriptional regulator